MASLTGHVPAFTAVHGHSPWGALLSRSLPTYSGRFKVGVREAEFPVEVERIGSFARKPIDGEDSKAGFELETILFTLFYPCEPKRNEPSKVMWFPRLEQTIAGLLKMGNRESRVYRWIARLCAGIAVTGTTFPAYNEGNLLSPPEGEPYPLIVFSHGVGSPRLMYSAFCGEMASRGYVVAAVEHRDGSGPHTIVTLSDGRTKTLEFMNWDDVYWPELEDQPEDETIFRHDQLKMRLSEIDGVVEAIKLISDGQQIQTDAKKGFEGFDQGMWKGKIDAERYVLAGHSFGGTAVIAAAADPRFTPRAVIATDPAMQRLDPWKGEITCPLLAVNSEEFADSDDFERLLDATKTVKSRSTILTIPGSTHPSFCDVFLILPGMINRRVGLTASPIKILNDTIKACEHFLDGTIQSVVEKCMVVRGRDRPSDVDVEGPMFVQDL